MKWNLNPGLAGLFLLGPWDGVYTAAQAPQIPLRILECSDLGSFLGQTPAPIISWGAELSRPPTSLPGCSSLNVDYLPQTRASLVGDVDPYEWD